MTSIFHLTLALCVSGRPPLPKLGFFFCFFRRRGSGIGYVNFAFYSRTEQCFVTTVWWQLGAKIVRFNLAPEF